MGWTKLRFGKYYGKTLPQVVAIDLDWFYWALPKLYGKVGNEARRLAQRMQAIKVPKENRRREVEYYFEDNRFRGFAFVRVGSPMCARGAIRLPYLDMSLARADGGFGKPACRKMTRYFRIHFFGENKRLTKKRCEKFFSNRRNFVNP